MNAFMSYKFSTRNLILNENDNNDNDNDNDDNDDANDDDDNENKQKKVFLTIYKNELLLV